MMGAWLVYGLVVSALVSVAAWAAERGARALRWPTRWVWVGALILSPALPLAAWLRPSPAAPGPPLGAGPMVSLGALGSLTPLSVTGGAPEPLAWATWIQGGWLAASFMLLLGVLALALRLWLRRRHWRRVEIDGVDVLVSRHVGPAAIGLIRGLVVVPEWALRLPSVKRRLLVLHEAEHVRARDPQVSLLGLLACVVTPWNLPMWWQLRRLRLAVEVDCDARVLRRTGDARRYGALLLEVGRHRARLALALAEPRSMLERRLTMIMRTTTRRAKLRAAGLAALSGLVLAVACETPGPTGPTAAEREPLDEGGLVEGVEGMDCSPLIYLNGRPSTTEALDRLPAQSLERVHVFRSEAAKAEVDADPTCGVVVALTRDASPEEADAGRRLVERLTAATGDTAATGPSLDEVAEEPTFTPMTVRPALTNPEEVRAALERLYPPLLKEAGIGGVVNVWFFIDREGVVRETRLRNRSEHEALDQAALAVAEVMEFTPAYNREQRVPVWVALDIQFDAGAAEPAQGAVSEDREAMERSRPGADRRLDPSEAPGVTPRADRATPPDAYAGPTFTPMTQAPRLKNGAQISEALKRLYPPMLRDAGIGGTVNVWFLIDDEGGVVKVQVNESSGREELDAAALEVARGMRFEPARNGEDPVTVWVALDITFATD